MYVDMSVLVLGILSQMVARHFPIVKPAAHMYIIWNRVSRSTGYRVRLHAYYIWLVLG